MREFRAICWTSEGRREICFNAAEESEPMANWLIGYFEAAAKSGAVFRTGETVQIGWALTMLKERSAGGLEVQEPDFDAFPIRWKVGVDNVLRHLQMQQTVCEELGFEMTLPSMTEAGIAAPQWFTNSGAFTMSRDTPDGADSGWVFNTPENVRNEGAYFSLYEISLAQPRVIPFLGLPVGSEVSFRSGTVSIGVAGKEIPLMGSPVLQRLVESATLV